MKRYTFLLLLVWLSLYSCGGGDDNPPTPPASATLVFPEQNSECTTGVSISVTQSSVTFSWGTAANTDSYRLTITHLISGFIDNYTTTSTSFEANLLKGEPYSWSVTSISESSSQTAQSEVWNFYNAGEGVESYAPFPADVVSPDMGATVVAAGGNLTLQWNGVDVDNDISAYDVYFDVVNPPVAIAANSVSSESFQVNGLTPSTVYYWRIVTTDIAGNTSASEIFEFRTID